jgi:hypothetical protein
MLTEWWGKLLENIQLEDQENESVLDGPGGGEVLNFCTSPTN